MSLAEFFGQPSEVGASRKLNREDAWLGRCRAGQLSEFVDCSCVAESAGPALAGWTEHRGSFAYAFTWPAAEFWARVVQPGSVQVNVAIRVPELASSWLRKSMRQWPPKGAKGAKKRVEVAHNPSTSRAVRHVTPRHETARRLLTYQCAKSHTETVRTPARSATETVRTPDRSAAASRRGRRGLFGAAPLP